MSMVYTQSYTASFSTPFLVDTPSATLFLLEKPLICWDRVAVTLVRSAESNRSYPSDSTHRSNDLGLRARKSLSSCPQQRGDFQWEWQDSDLHLLVCKLGALH